MKVTLLKILSFFFLVAAVYHFVGLLSKLNTEPLWRNGLFVLINLFCFYGLLNRPKYFIYLFAVLVLQQLYSHGQDILKLWSTYKQIDWLSLGVVIYMPVVFLLLVMDNRNKKTIAR
ncbi:MAG TPA: hypothetical protein VK783_15380 [Bacteroidia bacterium]|nr:hypothetical protein [Bacteroidia bacterium]